ncbi:MAG TPA: VOC family protein [Thermoanaerobaculia bacterium]|nr:VOC family protein [Thermoanaerobaculia bacterium]
MERRRARSASPAGRRLGRARRFHHVHLNVADVGRTREVYERAFGAQPIRFRGVADALYTERSFILLTQVAEPPAPSSQSGLWHIGWGSTDVAATARRLLALVEQGLEVDTPLYTIPGSGTEVTYWRGPDGELIEVNTMGHHRFAHVHLLSSDVNATTDWFTRHLGLEPRRARVERPTSYETARAWSNAFRCDNVSFVVYGAPLAGAPGAGDIEGHPAWWRGERLERLEASGGQPFDHVAFSYREIEPVLERMRAGGARIVEGIAWREELGIRSFFVEAPDGVLVEVVEAKPIPEGVWE